MKPGQSWSSRQREPRWQAGAVAAVGVLVWMGWAVMAGAGMIGTAHDFVDDGFTGGGACVACHVAHDAGDERLWPRAWDSGSYPTAPRRLCMDCHFDPASSLAAIFSGDPTWANVTAVLPRSLPSGHLNNPNSYLNCVGCHQHTSTTGGEAFVPDTDDCLSCHREGFFNLSEPPGGWVDDDNDLEVDKFFAGVGAAPPYTIRSEHNVFYDTGGDLSTTAANECRKCHGRAGDTRVDTALAGAGHDPYNGHPKDHIMLVDPDGNYYPDARAGASDFTTYEAFCISCHDGQVDGTQGPEEQQFGNGSIPTDQVEPTDPANPAALQTAPPWVVPAVPPTSTPPYFPNYSTNGHGANTALIIGNPMNITCLNGGAGQGCHTAHGSRNHFLLNNSLLGVDVVTASQFAIQGCEGCHERGLNFAIDSTDGVLGASTFHGWWANGSVLHDNSRDGTADGMAEWVLLSDSNLDISGSPGVLAGTMPFYGAPTGGSNRIYQRSFPTTGLAAGDWMHCLTCHDPHGTGPNTQAGMLRRFPDSWDYADTLCGQCHVE